MPAMTEKEANELLPSLPTKTPTDARRLKYLIIGPPKWGKTTFGCSAPDSVLFAFEEGHAFHETHKVIIDAWAGSEPWEDEDGNTHLAFEDAVEAICASNRFQFVVMDTADMAAKMCLDYHYKKYRVNHASDAGDYGKGWDLCLTQPFRQQISKLMKSGRGIAFITHTNIVEKKVGNVTQSRAETTLPSQVQKLLHTQADLILHGNFGKKRRGMLERDRIISLDGSNEILAGSRVRGIVLPKKFIVDPLTPWEQWASFFTDPKAVEKADQQYVDLVLGGKEAEELAAAPEVKTISEPLKGEGKTDKATPSAKSGKTRK